MTLAMAIFLWAAYLRGLEEARNLQRLNYAWN